MGNTKWLRMGLVIVLMAVMLFGYGGLCDKKDKAEPIATGSSITPAQTTLTGMVYEQTSDTNIIPAGDATVTLEWEEEAKSVTKAVITRTVSAKVRSDGSYFVIGVPQNKPITVTISSADTIQTTDVVTTTVNGGSSSSIVRARSKKNNRIRKDTETTINTFDDTTMPRCQITVPAQATSTDIDGVFLTTTHQGEHLPRIPDGYTFIAGAEFKTGPVVTFASGKEATPYIILPAHIKAEDLSTADIKLMEFVDGRWVITTSTGKGKAWTTGQWSGYIGPHDTETPAKLKGIRPWCWVTVQATPATVSGTVKDSSGNPIAGAFIFGGGAKTHSNPDGTYTLRNITVLKADSLVATNCSATNYKLAHQFVKLSPGGSVTNVHFTLESEAVTRLAELTGKVSNSADNTAIYGAIVTLSTQPVIRGLRYDDKTTADLTDDTFYVIPPPGVTISQYKWSLNLPDNSKFTSSKETGSAVILQHLSAEAVGAGKSLSTGAYRVELEVTYSSGKKSVVSGGFLLNISLSLTLYIADIRLPMTLQDQLTLKAMSDQQGNYGFINLPIDEVFNGWAKADGFIYSNPVAVSALNVGERRVLDFPLAALSTDTTNPASPANVSVTEQSPGTIKLTWTASTDNTGIDHYRVYRGDPGIEIAKTPLNYYVDSGLQYGVTYYYVIGAFDKANNSALSSMLSVLLVVDNSAPTTPTNLAATVASSAQINLAWLAATDDVGVTGYKVYRDSAEIATTSLTNYSDTGLTATTTYTYKILAYDGTGNLSGFSVVITATTLATVDVTAPTVPANLTATAVSQGQINLAWSASTDNVAVTGYKVYRNGILCSTLSALSYSDSGLLAGTTYTYKVCAYDLAGNTSAFSSDAIAATLPFIDTTPPSIPTGLASSVITMTYCTITWNIATDNGTITGYRVYRSTDNANWTLIATVNTNSWTDSGLLPATTYYYKVEAVDSAGLPSGLSAAFTVATPADDSAPTAPTGLTATAVSQGQINLAWTASTDNIGVLGYYIYRNGVIRSTLLTTSYSDTGLTANTQYTYTVSAVDAAGNISAQSGSVNATTLPPAVDDQPPTVPTSLSATGVSISQVNLTWNASVDNFAVTGYKVFRNGTFISTLFALSYSDTGLTPGTVYNYTVSAYDAVGWTSAQSITATATTPADTTAPSVPTGLTGTAASTTQININWSASSDNIGVSGYKLFRNGTQIAQITGISYNDTGLTAGTTYGYTVLAYDAANNPSAQTSAVNITTQSAGSALVAHWKFDETSGTTAGDSSGNGNNGTVYGATWSGGALSFDGVDDYVHVPRTASLEPSEITISFWMYRGANSSNGTYRTVLRKANNNDAGYLIRSNSSVNPNEEFAGNFDAPNTTDSCNVTANISSYVNQWAHYTFTHNQTNGSKFYINGVLVSTNSRVINWGHTGDLFIGGAQVHYGDGYMEGKLDDMKIYNYARTAGEIQAEYNARAWTLAYQTDFSSDPGWTTNDSPHFYWDSTNQDYYMYLPNSDDGWATIEVPYTGGSFKIEYDVKILQNQWSSGINFGLFDTDKNYYSQSACTMIIGSADPGRGFGLDVWDKNNTPSDPFTFWGFSDNIWYSIVMEYNSISQTVIGKYFRKSDGVLIGSHTASAGAGFASDMKYLGASRKGFIYGSYTTIAKIDNVKFYTKQAWQLNPPFNPSTQDTVLATVNGNTDIYDNANNNGADTFNSKIFYWVKNDGTSEPYKVYCFDPASSSNSVVISNTSNGFWAIKTMKGNLYSSNINGNLWKYDGITATLVLGTPFTSNSYVSAMCEFNNKMFFGTKTGYIYESTDLSSFTLRATYSGNSSWDWISDLRVWNGYLYACTRESYSYAAKILRSADGINWSVMGTFSVYSLDAFVLTPDRLYVCSTENASGPSFAIRTSTDGVNWTRFFYTTSEGKVSYGRPVYFTQTGRAYFIAGWNNTILFPCYQGNIESRVTLSHGFCSLIELNGRLFGIGAQNTNGGSPTVISILGNYSPQ